MAGEGHGGREGEGWGRGMGGWKEGDGMGEGVATVFGTPEIDASKGPAPIRCKKISPRYLTIHRLSRQLARDVTSQNSSDLTLGRRPRPNPKRFRGYISSCREIGTRSSTIYQNIQHLMRLWEPDPEHAEELGPPRPPLPGWRGVGPISPALEGAGGHRFQG